MPRPCARPMMVKRRVSGGGVHDSRSMHPRIRKVRLLITHVLDSCVKLLAVVHISSASIRRPYLCKVFIERTSINGMQRTTDYPIAKHPLQQNPHASASHQNTQVSYGRRGLTGNDTETLCESLCRFLLTPSLTALLL